MVQSDCSSAGARIPPSFSAKHGLSYVIRISLSSTQQIGFKSAVQASTSPLSPLSPLSLFFVSSQFLHLPNLHFSLRAGSVNPSSSASQASEYVTLEQQYSLSSSSHPSPPSPPSPLLLLLLLPPSPLHSPDVHLSFLSQSLIPLFNAKHGLPYVLPSQQYGSHSKLHASILLQRPARHSLFLSASWNPLHTATHALLNSLSSQQIGSYFESHTHALRHRPSSHSLWSSAGSSTPLHSAKHGLPYVLPSQQIGFSSRVHLQASSQRPILHSL
mmetsp:Transcript_33790/g.55103  ORF Transcript_33790/g.55103 Transcript_33790/m.55103 type:complete len:272 (-) Transcript_33790:1686-2501(-)